MFIARNLLSGIIFIDDAEILDLGIWALEVGINTMLLNRPYWSLG
jgi:hypothetical protein